MKVVYTLPGATREPDGETARNRSVNSLLWRHIAPGACRAKSRKCKPPGAGGIQACRAMPGPRFEASQKRHPAMPAADQR